MVSVDVKHHVTYLQNSTSLSPWYNRTDWLGVKRQVAYHLVRDVARLLGSSGWHRLSPLAVFTSGVYLPHNGRQWQWIREVPTLKAFLKARSQNVSGNKQWLVACAIGYQKSYFSHELAIFWSAEKRREYTFSPALHHLSSVIFANATVAAFVLLRISL